MSMFYANTTFSIVISYFQSVIFHGERERFLDEDSIISANIMPYIAIPSYETQTHFIQSIVLGQILQNIHLSFLLSLVFAGKALP